MLLHVSILTFSLSASYVCACVTSNYEHMLLSRIHKTRRRLFPIRNLFISAESVRTSPNRSVSCLTSIRCGRSHLQSFLVLVRDFVRSDMPACLPTPHRLFRSLAIVNRFVAQAATLARFMMSYAWHLSPGRLRACFEPCLVFSSVCAEIDNDKLFHFCFGIFLPVIPSFCALSENLLRYILKRQHADVSLKDTRTNSRSDRLLFAQINYGVSFYRCLELITANIH